MAQAVGSVVLRIHRHEGIVLIRKSCQSERSSHLDTEHTRALPQRRANRTSTREYCQTRQLSDYYVLFIYIFWLLFIFIYLFWCLYLYFINLYIFNRGSVRETTDAMEGQQSRKYVQRTLWKLWTRGRHHASLSGVGHQQLQDGEDSDCIGRQKTARARGYRHPSWPPERWKRWRVKEHTGLCCVQNHETRLGPGVACWTPRFLYFQIFAAYVLICESLQFFTISAAQVL